MKKRNKNTWKFSIYVALFLSVHCLTAFSVEAQSNNLANKDKINLLIVHSFEETLSDYPDFNRLVAENLKKKNVSVNINIFYLDCDIYGHDLEIDHICGFLDTLSVKPDIIMAVDDQATYSLLASKHPLIKTLPVVFSGVNFPNWDLLKEYPNVTGLWDNPDYEKNVEFIEDMLGIKRIRFFYDKTYNGKRVIERLAEQYNGKDDTLYQSLSHFLQYQDSILNDGNDYRGNFNRDLRGYDYGEKPKKTGFYFLNMRDEVGGTLMWNISGSFKHSVFLLTKYDYTIANVGRLVSVPIFSAVNRGFTYKRDILGGYFTTAEDQIAEACDYISRIVNGEKIMQLPIKESSKKYVVDWEVLKRWDIPISDVPSYAEIVNIPFFVKYKTELIVFLSLFTIFIASVIMYLFFLYRREARWKRQAQVNLWKEKEFLSLALEGGNVFAWKYDIKSEEFTFDNEFLDSVQIASGVIALEDLKQKTHPDEREHAVAVLAKVVNGSGGRENFQMRIDINGNGYVWYEFRFLNVSGILGSESSVIGLVMNIQEYKDREEELTAARDLAAKAELKQSFLANMSHEIRTPLNAIVGFSNILVSADDLPNDAKIEYIHIINKNCELLLKLINDILEISRIESGNLSFDIETCNLNHLVDDVYSMCQLKTPPNVEFKKNTGVALHIDTDAMRVKQVIVNFINNAFKFTSSGSVCVGIENDNIKKEVCIYVEDTGSGIPEEEQKMIFNRFYKVDEFVQGTGLGLSICQVIADKLNGRITLSSEVDKGSRFGFILPYSSNLYTDLHEKASTIYDITENIVLEDETRPVVLIAEDSVSNYMILNDILKKHCNIIWASNGKDALDIIKKRKIDLVLMDIKMHEMDGITALIKIRKSFKHLPVIIQTAYAFEENQNLAQQAGVSGFIAKPIYPDILLNEIRKFIQID